MPPHFYVFNISQGIYTPVCVPVCACVFSAFFLSYSLKLTAAHGIYTNNNHYNNGPYD